MVSRAVYGRRPGRRSSKGYPPVMSLRGHYVRHRHRDRRFDRGARRRLEGDRGCDGIDDVVEIVVVPVPPNPSRVGGISECGRGETDEQNDDAQHQDPTSKRHGWIIAPLRDVVKRRGRGLRCVGASSFRRYRPASPSKRHGRTAKTSPAATDPSLEGRAHQTALPLDEPSLTLRFLKVGHHRNVAGLDVQTAY